MHLAGHQHCGTHIVDTHDRPVISDVWKLFKLAWARTGDTSVLLEWDSNIPSFDDCVTEVCKANRYMDGEFDSVRMGVTAGEDKKEAVSNPVDFLVPEIMKDTLLEKS